MTRPAPSSVCQHAVLARSTVGHVSVCADCGVVHLSLHSLTVRLELAAFAELTAMLAIAQKRLHLGPSRELGTCEHQPSVIH